MKTATVHSAVLVGLEARPVTVTASVSTRAQTLRAMRAIGVQDLSILGLPSEAAERETRVRVLAALATLGVRPDGVGVVVDPPPPAGCSQLDLAVAVAVLAALGEVELPDGIMFLGELSLGGQLRPVRGVLPLTEDRTEIVVVPADNAREASLVHTVPLLRTLADVVDFLRDPMRSTTVASTLCEPPPAGSYSADLSEIRGHAKAKRALEVAAAGGHSVLLVGPPGAGKTLLARALAGLLPPMTRDEVLEVTRIHSVAGLVDGALGYVPARPFRAPHHTVSEAGLVGGGATPRPGEVSLAHRGVLFLDELPEFRAGAIEVLATVLRHGASTFARSQERYLFPARPALVVASASPCPCGYRGQPTRQCRCTPERVAAYLKRIPRDLFDLVVDVPALTIDELRGPASGETSATVRGRVAYARAWTDEGGLTEEAEHLSQETCPKHVDGSCTARMLRVARTIADLEGSRYVETQHVREARGLCGGAS